MLEEVRGSTGAASSPSPPSPAHAVSPRAIKSGISQAWAAKGNNRRDMGGGVSLGVAAGTTVSMAHVLDFLLTAAQLHRVAAATTQKVRSGGRFRGSGGQDRVAASANPASTTATLPPATQTWARLLNNPAASMQEQTLALLQVALQDGLLDSILPYMVSSLNLGGATTLTPTPTAAKTPAKGNSLTPASTNSCKSPRGEGSARYSPTHSSNTLAVPVPKEEPRPPPPPAATPSIYRSTPDRSPAIVIHVCDEARGLRQDFSCPRDLLIHHIGYFADVTAGQRLEDVDISVHCDVTIFEWLLRWVKQGQTEDHVAPVLEPKTAVSILISAEFLKMTPLVEEVLQYVHDNINLILEAQVNLTCLSDAVLSRLARLFTHWELEGVRDRRDRILNKLYARFLQALCDVSPSPSRGIFKTAGTLYRCCDCGQLVTREVERLVTCVASNTIVTATGQVYYSHTRDGNWSLTDHVKQLKLDLKTWRLVYWRLWGQVHFLPCSTCGAVFPGYEMRMCRTHPLDASSCDMDQILASDTHPCCGARALRFSPLPVRNGCQVTEHTVQLSHGGDEDVWGPIPHIYDDLLTFQQLACLEPPPQVSKEAEDVLWTGVPLVPFNRAERSLLDRSWLSHYLHAGEREGQPAGKAPVGESNTVVPSQGVVVSSVGVSSESSSDEEEGGSRARISMRLKANLIRRANRARRTVACEVMVEQSLRWDAGRSTRHNQDAQRERESRVLRDLTSWLTLAAPNTHDAAHGTQKGHRGRPDRRKECSSGPDPGCYYRLEAEFRERHGGHSHGQGGGGGGTFRAKVQAISRIKLRLRHRAAFSASR
ncbi:SANT and BTB domain regulator of class switch recombination-like [Scylla paramamosain]|uniref:SANT and BTB domain regulator of class switch recombination-like n=1 Tax=Scylla paramamosain TaxID=85552 RepID=UPI0030836D4A